MNNKSRCKEILDRYSSTYDYDECVELQEQFFNEFNFYKSYKSIKNMIMASIFGTILSWLFLFISSFSGFVGGIILSCILIVSFAIMFIANLFPNSAESMANYYYNILMKQKKIEKKERSLEKKNRVVQYMLEQTDLPNETYLFAMLEKAFRVFPNLKGHEETEIYYVGSSVRTRPILVDDWWEKDDTVDFLIEWLNEQTGKKEKDNQLKIKRELDIVGKQIRNEKETISLEQMRNWKCMYCGNVNRGTDNICVGCNAPRE